MEHSIKEPNQQLLDLSLPTLAKALTPEKERERERRTKKHTSGKELDKLDSEISIPTQQ